VVFRSLVPTSYLYATKSATLDDAHSINACTYVHIQYKTRVEKDEE
jgi:hypothetical protein